MPPPSPPPELEREVQRSGTPFVRLKLHEPVLSTIAAQYNGEQAVRARLRIFVNADYGTIYSPNVAQPFSVAVRFSGTGSTKGKMAPHHDLKPSGTWSFVVRMEAEAAAPRYVAIGPHKEFGRENLPMMAGDRIRMELIEARWGWSYMAGRENVPTVLADVLGLEP